MSRPTIEVADLIRAQGGRFVEQHRSWLSYRQLKVLRAIERCRTMALGGHLDECSTAVHRLSLLTPVVTGTAQSVKRKLVNAGSKHAKKNCWESYFHVVFTLPHLLNPLCRNNAKLLYDLLFRTAAETMIEVAADPKHLGAEIGFLAILHTWGQNLSLHPHIHCVVPAGGLSADHTQWVRPRYNFFLPVKVLSRVFRGKFVDGLRRAYRRHRLSFGGSTVYLQKPKEFDTFLRTLFKQDWVVYAKPAFGGPTQVLHYLGRYTHRVAIGNYRLLAFDGQNVSFRWKNYAHGNKQRVMMLSAEEFLRRYVQHVLPLGFVRIRPFGFLANSRRGPSFTLIQQLLAITTKTPEPAGRSDSNSITWICPRCGGSMHIQHSFTAAQLTSLCRPLDSS